VKSILETPWSALVDRRRLDVERTASLLRDLGHRSFDHLFRGSSRPVLTSSDLRILRVLYGRPRWSWADAAGHRRMIQSGLHLATDASATAETDTGLLVTASTRRRSWPSRIAAGFFARRSGLIAGRLLAVAVEELAWSSPTVSATLIAAVRSAWRQSTLFEPDEPVWPDMVAIAVVKLVVAMAIHRPPKRRRGWLFWKPGPEDVLDDFDGSLDKAVATVAAHSTTEQLIVLDAARRAGKDSPPEVIRLLAALPISKTVEYAELMGSGAKPGKAATGEAFDGAMDVPGEPEVPVELTPFLRRYAARAL
jgi:hypothetical protein